MTQWQPRFGYNGEYKMVDLCGQPIVIDCETREEAQVIFDNMTHDPNYLDLGIEYFYMWERDGKWMAKYNPENYSGSTQYKNGHETILPIRKPDDEQYLFLENFQKVLDEKDNKQSEKENYHIPSGRITGRGKDKLRKGIY